MSALRGAAGPGLTSDGYSDIVGPPAPDRNNAVMLETLSAPVRRVSLRSSLAESSATLAPLTLFVGVSLTVANPAWSSKPVDAMRALQKALLGHALTQPPDRRADSLAAIDVVERAVQLRLRFQQMDEGPPAAAGGGT